MLENTDIINSWLATFLPSAKLKVDESRYVNKPAESKIQTISITKRVLYFNIFFPLNFDIGIESVVSLFKPDLLVRSIITSNINKEDVVKMMDKNK